MLSKAGCLARRERLWQQVPSQVNWVLITAPWHVTYLSNFQVSPFVFRGVNADAALLLRRNGACVLVADNVQAAYADEAFVDERLIFPWYDGKHSAGNRGMALVHAIAKLLTERVTGSLGYEAAHVPEGVFQASRPDELVTIDDVLLRMRRMKDDDELALLRQSVKAGEAGMAAARNEVRHGMTEMDVFYLVQHAAQAVLQGQCLIYGDFVSGPRCEQGGGPPSERKLQRGDLVLIDFSTVVRSYRADFACTFTCEGEPTIRQREFHRACSDAMQAGEALLKAGQPAIDVDRAVRGSFAERNLNQFFGHHAGHGLGLGHPEAPFFVPESSNTLMAGDVVTLEPGLYVRGEGGMRIERNYLITPNGFEILSHHRIGL